MKRRRLSIPAALAAAACFTVGRYLLIRHGYTPGPWVLLLISPLIEETVYRGMLFGSLREECPFSAAAAVSAVFFALGHQGPARFLLGLAFGLGAAWITERTGRLRWAVLAHIGWNLCVRLISSSLGGF